MGKTREMLWAMRVPLTLLLCAGIFDAPGVSAQGIQLIASRAAKAPIHFEMAKDAPNSPFKYSARTESYSLFLSSEEADVVLHGESVPPGEISRGKPIVVQAYASLLRMRFMNADLPTSIGPLDTAKPLRTDTTAVTYRGLYPGTDVVFRGDQKRIGFQLNVVLGADLSDIVLELTGATSIGLDTEGNAIVRVGSASLTLEKPSIVVGSPGATRRFIGAYRIETHNRLRFVTGAVAKEERFITD